MSSSCWARESPWGRNQIGLRLERMKPRLATGALRQSDPGPSALAHSDSGRGSTLGQRRSGLPELLAPNPSVPAPSGFGRRSMSDRMRSGVVQSGPFGPAQSGSAGQSTLGQRHSGYALPELLAPNRLSRHRLVLGDARCRTECALVWCSRGRLGRHSLVLSTARRRTKGALAGPGLRRRAGLVLRAG